MWHPIPWQSHSDFAQYRLSKLWPELVSSLFLSWDKQCLSRESKGAKKWVRTDFLLCLCINRCSIASNWWDSLWNFTSIPQNSREIEALRSYAKRIFFFTSYGKILSSNRSVTFIFKTIFNDFYWASYNRMELPIDRLVNLTFYHFIICFILPFNSRKISKNPPLLTSHIICTNWVGSCTNDNISKRSIFIQILNCYLL